MDHNNFTMIEEVYGRAAAESVQKMLDIAQEAVSKMHDLYSKINALEADNARLRDALRPLADAWLTVSLPDEVECRLATVSKGKIIHMLVYEDGWLHASALRAAHLALHPDDTGGDDDED